MTSVDNSKFSLRFVSLNETLDGVNKSNLRKVSQANDINLLNVKVAIIQKPVN